MSRCGDTVIVDGGMRWEKNDQTEEELLWHWCGQAVKSVAGEVGNAPGKSETVEVDVPMERREDSQVEEQPVDPLQDVCQKLPPVTSALVHPCAELGESEVDEREDCVQLQAEDRGEIELQKPVPSDLAEQHEQAIAAFLRENGYHGLTRSKWKVGSDYPLHCSASQGLVRMTDLLIKAGADPTQKNSWGQTPADVARKRNKGGSHKGVLEVLGRATAAVAA